MKLAKCKTCGSTIAWVKTSKNKNMPLDANPRPDGNVTVTLQEDGSYLGLVHGPAGVAQLDAMKEQLPRFVSHFLTCAQAAAHRRTR